MMTSKEFKELRESNHLSKAALSRLLQLTPMTIYRYETGRRRIPHTVGVFMHNLGLKLVSDNS